jgi:RNA polymerase sigma-70 factor (ECF subfamily)
MTFKASHNEALLVRNLSNGDFSAFNTLYHTYSARLYRFAVGYLKSEDESEELVQEVFTIIWNKRTDLQEELSFKSFLFTISFNIIRKHFRTKKYLAEYFARQIGEKDDHQTLQNINYNSLFEFISEVVDKLPDRRREIFIKSRFEGLNNKEIAEALNISQKTVENQITEALKYLRLKLNRERLAITLFISLFIS